MKKLMFVVMGAVALSAMAAEVKTLEKSQMVVYVNGEKTLKQAVVKDVSKKAEGVVKPSEFKWILATVGDIELLVDEKNTNKDPIVAIVASGDFDSKVVLEDCKKAAEKKGDKWTSITTLGFPAYSVPLESVVGEKLPAEYLIKPCMGAVAKDVVVLASSEKVLKDEQQLFAGKIAAGSFGKKKLPDCCLCLKVDDVDKLVAADEARKTKKGIIPESTAFKNVKTMRLLVDSVEGDKLSLRLTLACKDEASAEELEAGLLVMTVMVKEFVKELSVARKGKTVVVSGTLNPSELMAMALLGAISEASAPESTVTEDDEDL